MFTRINGHLLSTVAFGSGPRTLVAHGGWVGSWELWQQPFELLSDEWRCISYDHRGTGESPVSPEQITPEALVDDLFAVLDAYGVRRCVLAGESLGTLVSWGPLPADQNASRASCSSTAALRSASNWSGR